jgi:uroporphyrinogen decarboxylase
MTIHNSPLLTACRREETPVTPVWFMRQAGRYMAEYRAIREKYSMLETIRTPELAAEITLQPINALGVDAAIIFADILPPLIGMGLELSFEAGHGPVIHNPIKRPYDVDILATPPASATLAPTLEAIKLVTAELAPQNIPLIGFAGAPFTLASYAIEGGGSRDYAKAKSFMYHEPAAWARLMNKLVTVQGDYLLAQAKAGAQALQVFDSWAGALSESDYRRYVLPYNKALFAMLGRAGVPIINFSTRTSGYLELVASAGGDVVGVDWQLPLDKAWAKLAPTQAIMGNLDPILLLAPWRELRPHIDEILQAANGRAGHIFNLGHGILPQTPVEMVRRVVEYVHEQTR